jgi:hypothetical protein
MEVPWGSKDQLDLPMKLSWKLHWWRKSQSLMSPLILLRGAASLIELWVMPTGVTFRQKREDTPSFAFHTSRGDRAS